MNLTCKNFKNKIARPRFELGSRAPKAPMLDRYTRWISPLPGFRALNLQLSSLICYSVLGLCSKPFFEGCLYFLKSYRTDLIMVRSLEKGSSIEFNNILAF